MKNRFSLIGASVLLGAFVSMAQAQPLQILTQPTNEVVLAGGAASFSVTVSGAGPFTYQWQFNGTNLPGLITTVAGNGTMSYSGDGGPATEAELNYPDHMAIDASGNLFIADQENMRVRQVRANGIITTVAGNGIQGYAGDGGQATNAELSGPVGVAVDTTGNLFIADGGNDLVREVRTNGIITTVAGNGTAGYSGDGIPATNAEFAYPCDVVVDASGRLFIADFGNNRIREVGTNGIITTVAGNGARGFFGDGGPATEAELSGPIGVAVDATGNLFIADQDNDRIREVGTNGIITTVAGNGTSGFSGDGGSATNAELGGIGAVALDTVGNLFIADTYNQRIREVVSGRPMLVLTDVSGANGGSYEVVVSNPSGSITSSIVTLVVLLPPAVGTEPQSQAVAIGGNATLSITATGTAPFDYQWFFDGAPLQNQTNTTLQLSAVAFTNAGAYNVVVTNLYGSATSAVAVVSVGLPPAITTQPASQTDLAGSNASFSVAVSGAGPFTYQWQFDGTNLPNLITTVAGDGIEGYSGDGGPATDAELYSPQGVAVDASGKLFIADTDNYRIRRVRTNGIITTVAGDGIEGYSGDGGLSISAKLSYPSGVAVDASGNLFIADTDNNRIRKVGTNGIITTVAGNGTYGYSGDGGPAASAELSYLSGVAVDAPGNLFIADTENQRIRKVGTNGIITTVAGNGRVGYSGDGGPATNAELSWPAGVAVDASGNVFFAEQDNNVIRKVETDGIITTVAGNGTPGYFGDGGAAANAELNYPTGVTVDVFGNLFIADSRNNVVREVEHNGIITTVAGDGGYGFFGDGGAATNAAFSGVGGVAVDDLGNLFIADENNQRIREVIVEGPALALPNVGGANAGSYDVVVSTPYGSVTSSVATLAVVYPPSITLEPISQVVVEGQDVSFTASASGTPPLIYQWQVNGTNLPGATNVSLSLPNVAFSAAGAYSLVVSNSFGVAPSSNAALVVLPAIVTTEPASAVSDFNAVLNGSITPGTNDTSIWFQWGLTIDYGNTTAPLSSGTSFSSLDFSSSLSGLAPTAVYHYRAVASNVLGVVNGADVVFQTINIPFSQTTASNDLYWVSVASSADGSKLAAAASDGGIYTSSNHGAIWSASAAPTASSWSSITSSADGTKLAAAANYGSIYTSTNSGADWILSGAPAGYWSGIASSSNGSILFAAQNYNNSIYLSLNAGKTWTATHASDEYWEAVTSSPDGTRLAATDGNNVYTSANSGVSWTHSTGPSVESIASSDDGTNLAAAGYNGIYLSRNSGTTWTKANAPIESWVSVAASADGVELVAAANYGPVCTSTNSGLTWVISGPTNSWTSTAASADGTQFVAASAQGIYVWSATAPIMEDPPLIQTVAAGSYVVLAAPVDISGARFTLQWEFNGSNIAGATNAALILDSALLSDSGAYTLLVSNGYGTVLGTNAILTVLSAIVSTQPPNAISDTTAILDGLVIPGSSDTWVWFQWGLDTNYGNSTPPQDIGQGFTALVFSNLVSGLVPGAICHYRAIASNTFGMVVSPDATFLTLGLPFVQTTAPDNSWSSVSSSSDGTALIAAPYGDSIYTSSNSGVTWTQTATPINYWQSVASSGDGVKLAAVIFGGPIYVSPDAGTTWQVTPTPANYWTSIASSLDGSKLVAVATQDTNGNLGYIVNSDDFGVSWALTSAPYGNWTTVASSADGNDLIAGRSDGGLYSSTDSGGLWGWPSVREDLWVSVASSADGSKLIATETTALFISTNFGVTWTYSSAPYYPWSAVGSSADGTKLIAAANSDQYGNPGWIYTSPDGGATWVQHGPGANWLAVASSADASHLVAASDQGIYVLSSASSPLPVIDQQPVSQTVSAGQSVTFDATAFGALPLSYQWEFRGLPLIGATNSTLALSNVTLAKSGNYALIVSNTFGAVMSSNAALTVIPPGAIIPNQWTLASAPTNFEWSSVAASADGTKLVAAAVDVSGDAGRSVGPIYSSADSGVTWNLTSAPLEPWNSIASSADGVKLVAIASDYSSEYPNPIYISADYGATWQLAGAPTSQYWLKVTSSANGTKLAVTAGSPSAIYTSSDSGATWTVTSAPNVGWGAIASSADGTKLVAAGQLTGSTGSIYTSSDSGTNWTLTSAPNENWVSVASSSDGTRLAAVPGSSSTGYVWTSSDSGATWHINYPPKSTWFGVASSANGNKLFACQNFIYASANAGESWTKTSAPSGQWSAVTTSADGNCVIAAVSGGGIYVFQGLATPAMNVIASGANVLISWVIPSMSFQLQQNSNLDSTNWTDAGAPPVLNLTNLYNEVLTAPPPAGCVFYRLKH
jgi:sugar lactone lactonase YvrE